MGRRRLESPTRFGWVKFPPKPFFVIFMPLKDKQALSAYQTYWKRMHPEVVRYYRDNFRKKILAMYGGKCACCGYSDLDKKVQSKSFLQIDHINGGGAGHVHQIGSHSQFYSWLHKELRPGFRVLCACCNAGIEPGQDKCELHLHA